MRKLVISLCIALSMTMCACGSINGNVEMPGEDEKLKALADGTADAESATSTPTETPTPKPVDVSEEVVVDEDTGDPYEDFTRKIKGVWGNLEGGFYFECYEGSEMTSGWFESDALPNAHIKNVDEISKNKYHVVMEFDQGYDEDGEVYDGFTYEATFDGTGDGFSNYFITSTDNNDYLYMKLGNNMDEALDYYHGNLLDDYHKLEEEHKGELRESPVGQWFTDGYDEIENWAESYYIILNNDGSALCTGWRNKDTGTYEITGPGKVLITFDHCECDDPEVGGWTQVNGFKYTIDMEYSGNDATIKINAPDVISNLTNGTIHRK